MGRKPGSRFLFPLPRRKSHSKAQKDSDDSSSIPSVPELVASHYDESTNISKAQRVLGTTSLPYRHPARQSPIPQSPGYMTVTVSEASYGSELDDRASSTAVDDSNFPHLIRPIMSRRPSSNVLGHTYNGDERRGSNCSSVSRRLHPTNSNNTMRSHYDAKSSPLAISQQTSDSAVRDMALRKGMPQITPSPDHDDEPADLYDPNDYSEDKTQHRKSKPPRLDLSKLFPKPKSNDAQNHSTALLSPTKMVNSPVAMSINSDYFPRPMAREPTPKPPSKLSKASKSSKRPQSTITPAQVPTSPVRLYKRDMYDNAKVNVRRPPRGIQHWFDGLDDDSEEEAQEQQRAVHAPKPIHPLHPASKPQIPVRKTSLGRLVEDRSSSQYRTQQQVPVPRKDHLSRLDQSTGHRLNSPSSYSLGTQSSYVSNKTKESALSRSNLQDSSILSFSSSEDEGEDTPATNKFSVQESLDSGDEHGDIIIGQAQAFEVRPSTFRTPSVGKMSMLSTETNAGTIEVMYTPETATSSFSFRGSSFHGSRRSSHVRHPSVIPEDESYRPKTANNQPLSPSMHSVRSARTSRSEPRAHGNQQQKMMAVTAEEEALLEMMRKKRAAMAKQSFSEGYKSAIQQDESRQKTPPETAKKAHRTSAFLTMESPGSSPVRVVDTKPKRKSSANHTTPLLIPPRGWSVKGGSRESSNGMTMLHDNSSYDTGSGSDHPTPSTQVTTIPHQLSPPPEFSPLDPFPTSPTQATSMASPTTVSHASPLPSPITPGPRNGDLDMKVKVASSEPSCSSNSDNDELIVLETGVIGPPSGGIKPEEPPVADVQSHHQRRRTASSGADMSFPVPPTSSTQDLTPVSEASSRAASVVDPTSMPPSNSLPKIPRKNSRRTSTLSVSTHNPHARTRSRQSSLVSSRTSSPAASTSHDRDRRRVTSGSRASSVASIKRESVAVGTASTRCSASEDVLAAWGSLGGMRDYYR